MKWKYTEYDGRYLGWKMGEMGFNWYWNLSECQLGFVTGTLAVLWGVM